MNRGAIPAFQRSMRKLREQIVLTVARLVCVPVEIGPEWYGATPPLEGEELRGALSEILEDAPPFRQQRPKLRLLQPKSCSSPRC